MFFITLEKIWKPLHKACAAASEHIFFLCVAASKNISCFLRNVRLLLKDIKKMCSCFWIFFVNMQMCGCFWEYFMFFKELAAASEKILKKKMCDCFWKKMCSCFLELCPFKKYFEVKELKIKAMLFMYFWLNYCDENHAERIPIAAENINHLFHLASEVMKADAFWQYSDWWGWILKQPRRRYRKLIVCTEEQIQKLLIYFELKKILMP